MTKKDTYAVGHLARVAGVSVRTLHHYDEVGLLTPARRGPAGYRLYTIDDLERLQQILFFRELGFTLAEIRAIMLDPGFERRAALEAQQELLRQKARRLEKLIAAVGAAIHAGERGFHMNQSEMFEAFGDFDPAEYEAEARRRWGGTSAYKESARRTASYTKDDWLTIRREEDEIASGMAELASRDPAAAEVQELVARKWRLINDRFYDCSPEMFAGLGRMYADDPRFARNYDKLRPGLAAFMCDAMEAYAAGRRR
jgi:MerR family transcriptional regulator, thiopeptide resistance regulator